MTDLVSPTREARQAQMFPVLAADEIAHMRRFGSPRRFADGERVFETGRPGRGVSRSTCTPSPRRMATRRFHCSVARTRSLPCERLIHGLISYSMP